MRYMVLLNRGDWEDNASEEEKERIYHGITRWWSKLVADGVIREGYHLQGPQTAKTVMVRGAHSRVLDGPYMEAKETVGGYAIFYVADINEAVRIVQTFPSPSTTAEVRPVVEPS